MNKELILRIVRSFRTRDEKTFLSSVRQLIHSERKQGHTKLADELQRLLLGTLGSPLGRDSADRALTDAVPRSKAEGVPLIDVRRPTKSLDDIVLRDETNSRINRFLHEFAKREVLARYGLVPKLKLLFFGPPGNGKTLCAEIIAAEMQLPLLYVRFDSLIGSYLGETASNLRRVFDYARAGIGILFFDEFDAIGKHRDDRNDVGELKRVVNSFLQLLDNYDGRGPIVAATNYENLLDHALWRRFDDAVYFPQPNEKELEQYLTMRLGGFKLEGFNIRDAASWCLGCSFSTVNRIVTDSIKTMALAGEILITNGMFRDALERARAADLHRLESVSNPSVS
jgi:SpoVK/Ycf46/Vps4 family AAA+-type ATPase